MANGTFTTGNLRLFKPDLLSSGWGTLEDENLDSLDAAITALQNAGGGGGDARINLATAPYGADPTGATWSDTAIKAFGDFAVANPGAHGWLPLGVYKVKSQLIKAEPGTTFTLEGDKGTTLLIGDNASDPLFGALGRHGYGTNESTAGCHFKSLIIDGNSRLYNADAWGGWWQGQDDSWEDIVVKDLKGSALLGTASTRPTMRDFLVTNSGDASAGSPSIGWKHSDEGGVIERICIDGVMDNVRVYGSDDFALYWMLTRGFKMRGCHLEGSGAARSTMYVLDGDGNVIVGNSILNGDEDCLQLASRGASQNNVVTGNVCTGALGNTPSTGFGVDEYSVNDEQTHTGNVIDHNVGTVHRA